MPKFSEDLISICTRTINPSFYEPFTVKHLPTNKHPPLQSFSLTISAILVYTCICIKTVNGHGLNTLANSHLCTFKHPSLCYYSNYIAKILKIWGLQYYVSSLWILTMKGGNTEAQKRIVDEEQYITFFEAQVCLNDPDVHPKLQSYYLDFVMSAFVHPAAETSGTDIENIWRSYVSLPKCAFVIYSLTSTSFSYKFPCFRHGKIFLQPLSLKSLLVSQDTTNKYKH